MFKCLLLHVLKVLDTNNNVVGIDYNHLTNAYKGALLMPLELARQQVRGDRGDCETSLFYMRNNLSY